MNFAEILDKWEKRSAKDAPYEKDTVRGRDDTTDEASLRGERRSRLLRKNPDASVDLHGLTRDEAWAALQTFFENARRNGNEKVLIIHGKGNHQHTATFTTNGDPQRGEGTLRCLTRRFIETCPFAGESGYGAAKEGGTGATWVIVKE